MPGPKLNSQYLMGMGWGGQEESKLQEVQREGSRGLRLDVMAYTFNSSTPEGEASGYLQVGGQLGLSSKFQADQNYTVRLCLKKIKNKK